MKMKGFHRALFTTFSFILRTVQASYEGFLALQHVSMIDYDYIDCSV